MTKQTRYFIEPLDIIGARFDCTYCGATILLPFSKGIRVEKLRVCPYCNEPWVRLDDSTAEGSIKELIEAATKVARIIEGGRYPGINFRLEIKSDIAAERDAK